MAITERTGTGERGTYRIRALERGLDILEAFTLASPELTIGEIRSRTGIPKPTIVRLLSVLSERRYIQRVPDSERYRLGVKTLEVGSAFLQSTSLEAEARPIMRCLADQTQQTANLGILDNDQVVHVEVVAPDRPVRFWASIGKREDAYVSALGKMLLTSLDTDVLETYLQQSRAELTPRTITEADDLRRELKQVSEQGYAIDDEESNPGLVCIAAPIHDGRGRMVAAVSISGLRAEFEEDGKKQEFVALVQASAADISTRLGWSPNHTQG